MKDYRVYFELPAYGFIRVRAKNEDAAKTKAEKKLAQAAEDGYNPIDYDIDWEADEKHAFTIEDPVQS